MTLLHIGWDFLKRKKGAFGAIIALQTLQVLLSLIMPAINARIIDDGILPENVPLIWRLGGVMLGIAILQILAMVGAIYLGAKTAMELGRELRARTFRQVQSFSATDQHKFGAPTLITRTTNDVTQVQMVILLTFTVMIMAPLMGFGGVFMAIQQNARLSLLLIVVVPLLGALIFFVIRALAPRYQIQQKRIDRINTLLREQLTGIRVIRAFVRQDTEREKFDKANKNLRDIWLQIGFLWAFMMPAANLIIGIASAAVVWFAGHLIEAGDMQVGALTAYITYLMMIMMAVMMSGMMVMMFPRGDVSAKRLQEIHDVDPSVKAPASPKSLPSGPITFELDGACLQYPGAEEPVLSDINMTFTPGKVTALIGSTGSGKSSIIRLLPRIIDATGGEVRAGGIPVTELAPKELRSRMALVPQTAFLFLARSRQTSLDPRVARPPLILNVSNAPSRQRKRGSSSTSLKKASTPRSNPAARTFPVVSVSELRSRVRSTVACQMKAEFAKPIYLFLTIHSLPSISLPMLACVLVFARSLVTSPCSSWLSAFQQFARPTKFMFSTPDTLLAEGDTKI